jgi:hypothetical protein
MDKFVLYVIVVTVIFLIIALTITGLVLSNNKSSTSYPPIVDNCPDYWYSSYYDIDSENSKPSDTCKNTVFGCCPDNITVKADDIGTNCPVSKCYNVQQLGAQTDTCFSVMDFSKFTTCQKQNWAKSCDLTWDGITNMPNTCGTTSTVTTTANRI